jgi:signal transduction histidine kinase
MSSMQFKLKVMLILVLVMTVPILIIGVGSALYYQDVVKRNIWDDNMAQAKAVSLHTPTYMDSARLYLESLADRPLVTKAMEEKNATFLDETARYTGITFKSINESPIFDEIFITDASGTVVSSYPHGEVVGKNVFNKIHVNQSILLDKTTLSDAVLSDETGNPTVYIAVPIDNSTTTYTSMESHNSTVYGALIGEINLHDYAKTIVGTQVKNNQYIYIVNRTGHVMVHNNHTYMDTMKDYSSVPAVQRVLNGEEDVAESYNPVEHDWRLAAFSPIPKYGWGAVVAMPVELAYKPISDTTPFFIASILLMTIIAILLAVYIGNYFTRPILDISRATAEIPDGEYQKYLPLARKDELGKLARSFDQMAGTIQKNKEAIIAARDRAEEERKRAELYVDIMGHDINNLNQVAMANLEVLKDSGELPADLRSMAGHALAAVEGSAGIIENVRKIQKFSSEGPHVECIDSNDLVNEAIRESSKPPDKKVEIHYSGTKGMRVKAAHLLKEAFSNIINNAIKYSGPEVQIDIEQKEIILGGKKYYEISISDNGPGIPDELKAKLFRRFQRGTTQAHGKGLGLYITKMLVERFGGKVCVEDRVPGDYTKGSKFIILLPAAQNP